MTINYLVLNGGALYTYTRADVLLADWFHAKNIDGVECPIYKRVPFGLTAGKFLPLTVEELKAECQQKEDRKCSATT